MISNGIDLIEINRFSNLINNKTFLDKNFSINELAYFNKHHNIQTLAGLYASKEAFLKALGVSLDGYNFKNIEILHNDKGKPYINLIKKDIDYKNISLSISHDNNMAIASVIIFF